MSTLLIANNCTRESGSFCGDQLCALKAAHMFAQEPGIDKILMSMSPGNEMLFLWQKFIDDYKIELIYDNWNLGDWSARWQAWDKWRKEREIEGRKFDHYRELYLRIHGAQRQTLLCGSERGLGRRNIYEYWVAGQENTPDLFPGSDVYDVEIYHPLLTPTRDVYISPHCKTQGNITFTFEYWSQVVHKLIDAGVTVTVGYNGHFCDGLTGHPLYKKHWGDHRAWMEQLCQHKIVACGNTGTGWLAAACGVPLLTMEPHNSVMVDHRYRECGLRNLVEVIDGYTVDALGNDMERVADYCARRIIEYCYGERDVKYVHIKNARVITEACRAAQPYSVNPFPKIKLMADEFLSVADLDGDVADLGTYRGGTALILRRLRPDKKLHLFDTWEGTPIDDEMCHHKRGEWKADIEECKKIVGDELLTYYQVGTFPNTTAGLEHNDFCFVYVDMDTYQATRDAIEFFWPRLVPGGKLFFDDYGWTPCAGVKKAVDEMLKDRKVCDSLYTCVVEKR